MSTDATHNAALQVVSGTAQEDLLLDHGFLGSHLGSSFAIVTSGDADDRAIKQRLSEKRRASCGGSKEG
jgi:hypothetical protein